MAARSETAGFSGPVYREIAPQYRLSGGCHSLDHDIREEILLGWDRL
jgi:hypothetical protein